MCAWDEEEDTTIYRVLSRMDRRQLDKISRSSGIAASRLEQAAQGKTRLTPSELKQVASAVRDRS